MRCLICGKEKLDESIIELWNYEDPLCLMCRKKLERIDYKMNYEGYPLEASYLYNEAYASALIQFKECNDEALKSIFLYGLKEQLRWKYKGYHLVFAPSSIQKIEKRGFSHLEEIFSELNMPYIDAFEKIDELSQKEKMGKERKDIVGKIVMKKGV
ncbi:MAG: hypothetical protein IJ875_06615, partial [Solobacterium sp.]|nr:hypothetical protein [Solobacterium sp.]